MHSGAQAEASAADLNRELQGDTSTSQPSESDTEQNSHHFNHKSGSQISEKQHQYPQLEKTSNQQRSTAEPENCSDQVAVHAMHQHILPHLDKDRGMQLQTLSAKVFSHVPVATGPLGPRTNIKTTPKQPRDALGTASPLASKRQKNFCNESVEQFNDVMTASGIYLTEEEEQLFSGLKEVNQTSETARRVAQVEEEQLILQKFPFQKKLAIIMSQCGIKNVSKDMYRCLSLCLEERMRGLIIKLIRASKQRADIEKSRHQTIITSDIKHQILAMTQKAKEREKKHAEEAKKHRKNNEKRRNPSLAAESGARNQAVMPCIKVLRAISVGDVISVLEREPQMLRSKLVYRLYEKHIDRLGNKE